MCPGRNPRSWDAIVRVRYWFHFGRTSVLRFMRYPVGGFFFYEMHFFFLLLVRIQVILALEGVLGNPHALSVSPCVCFLLNRACADLILILWENTWWYLVKRPPGPASVGRLQAVRQPVFLFLGLVSLSVLESARMIEPVLWFVPVI